METENTIQEAKSETRVLSQKRPRVTLSPSSHAQDQLFSLEREKATDSKEAAEQEGLGCTGADPAIHCLQEEGGSVGVLLRGYKQGTKGDCCSCE